MERQPYKERAELNPLEVAKQEIIDEKLTEFFGPGYADKKVLRVRAHYSQLEAIIPATLGVIQNRGLLWRSPTEPEMKAIEDDVMEAWTPKPFIASGGLKNQEADIIRSDVVGIVIGTFYSTGRRGLIGEKQSAVKEE